MTSWLWGSFCLAQSETTLSPCALAADAGLGCLYIAADTSAQILVWDTESRQVIRKISVAQHPRGLTLSPDDLTLYVTSAVPAGKVLIVDTRTWQIRHRVSVGHTPVAVALSPDGGTLYVCNQFDSIVSVVDLQTKTCVRTVPVLREPVALTVTSMIWKPMF